MLPELAEKLTGLDWEQARAAVAEVLGLPSPLPAAALRRAMVEDRYCFVLLAFRGNLPRLHDLVNDPRNRPYVLPGDGETPAPRPQPGGHSTAGLMIKAGQALNRWAVAGFPTVDQETLERRFAACSACPELTEPPVKWVYKVTLATTSDERICNACGCVASRKARLLTERCPRPDPGRPELSRWGEPFIARR